MFSFFSRSQQNTFDKQITAPAGVCVNLLLLHVESERKRARERNKKRKKTETEKESCFAYHTKTEEPTGIRGRNHSVCTRQKANSACFHSAQRYVNIIELHKCSWHSKFVHLPHKACDLPDLTHFCSLLLCFSHFSASFHQSRRLVHNKV